MDDILENIEDYNKKRKWKLLIVLDDMISHVMSDKRAQQVHFFLTQSYFFVPKDVRLNCIHYIIFKLNNKRELKNIAINNSTDICYEDFIKIYRDSTKELYNFLTIATTQLVDEKFKNNFNGP